VVELIEEVRCCLFSVYFINIKKYTLRNESEN
jgi:hypothetical protein